MIQKIEYNKFSLKKWDIYRKLVNQLVDVLVTRKKRQILFQFWIVSAKLGAITKRMFDNFTYIDMKHKEEVFQNMRWRRIQKKWRKICVSKGPSVDFRTQNKLRYWLSSYAVIGNMKLQD